MATSRWVLELDTPFTYDRSFWNIDFSLLDGFFHGSYSFRDERRYCLVPFYHYRKYVTYFLPLSNGLTDISVCQFEKGYVMNL